MWPNDRDSGEEDLLRNLRSVVRVDRNGPGRSCAGATARSRSPSVTGFRMLQGRPVPQRGHRSGPSSVSDATTARRHLRARELARGVRRHRREAAPGAARARQRSHRCAVGQSHRLELRRRSHHGGSGRGAGNQAPLLVGVDRCQQLLGRCAHHVRRNGDQPTARFRRHPFRAHPRRQSGCVARKSGDDRTDPRRIARHPRTRRPGRGRGSAPHRNSHTVRACSDSPGRGPMAAGSDAGRDVPGGPDRSARGAHTDRRHRRVT